MVIDHASSHAITSSILQGGNAFGTTPVGVAPAAAAAPAPGGLVCASSYASATSCTGPVPVSSAPTSAAVSVSSSGTTSVSNALPMLHTETTSPATMLGGLPPLSVDEGIYLL
ncbi:hypothetical protein NP493_1277g00095 [Ridgeia piscesae]|uniref:Uncharacterized protein n=1 Tax=Ridgeia piscesae TaxID=27915 RepID=A0AAD9KB69_RIDPI|nr:hypothetical protein NP493_1277g00095 [Ridgeia piscesae]